MESGLMNCPFCGGEAEINQIGNMATKSRGFEVRCTAWGCSTKKRSMVIRSSLEDARTWAVERWNTRARPPSSAPLLEALELALAVLEEADARLDYHPDSLGALEMEEALTKGYAALAAAKVQEKTDD